MNKVWAFLTLAFCFMPVEKVYKTDKKKIGKPVVYCANHTSYLDIPMVFRTIPGYFSIIGKAELSKVPLFGPMFKNVYVAVDRKSSRSRKMSLDRSIEVIDEGRSMVFYPEGTIPKLQPPQMGEFRDGAFRLAVEKQIPLVPITFPYNWIILPENLNTLATWHRSKVIYHEPIPTVGLSKEDIPALKQKVFDVITEELNRHFNNENR